MIEKTKPDGMKNTLVVKKLISQYDTGFYECRATIGEKEMSRRVNVIVSSIYFL